MTVPKDIAKYLSSGEGVKLYEDARASKLIPSEVRADCQLIVNFCDVNEVGNSIIGMQ